MGPALDTGGLKSLVRSRLLSGDQADLATLTPPEQRLRVRAEVLAVLREERAILPSTTVTEVVNEVSDEVVGFGPVERLLKDPEVSEVMVNGADDVFVERKGRIERVEGPLFEGEEQVLHLIERIVAPLGLRVDESMPFVDARLPDGSRVNAIIPPLSLCGPVITIRKFTLRPFTPGDLIQLGTLSAPMMEFLASCVRARANILVSGGTGTGKTSLLGVLSSFIRPDERLITIEDAAELRLSQPHVISLEARPPNVEGVGAVTVRTLVRNALRMRPDRIIIGEVRGGEALDMLQAMNTGHEGSLSTAHANSPRDLLSRLETMALMSDVQLPVSHVREQIAGALDLIIHMTRLSDGRRVVATVSAIDGLRGGSLVVQDIFTRSRGGEREFQPTGVMPSVLRLLHERNEPVDPRVFASMVAAQREAPRPRGSDGIDLDGWTNGEPDHPESNRLVLSQWPGPVRRLGTILE
jgi:pilus assembly protein CpaF